MEGKIRIVQTDHFAYDIRSKYEDMDRQSYIEKREAQLNQIEITEYQREKYEELSNAVTETFNFTTNNEIEIIDGKIFLRPLLFLNNVRNPFTAEKRELPIYFGHLKQQKFLVNIEIPEGYEIETMPKSVTITTGEEVCSFVFKIHEVGNKIQISTISEIKKAIVSADFYEFLKEYYKKMYEIINQKIVLKKI